MLHPTQQYGVSPNTVSMEPSSAGDMPISPCNDTPPELNGFGDEEMNQMSQTMRNESRSVTSATMFNRTSTVEEPKEDTPCIQKVVSVRTSIVFLCLLAILGVAVSTTVLYDHLYSKALDDTRESCDVGMGKLSGTARSSLNGLAGYLMGFSAEAIKHTLTNHLDRGFETALSLKALSLDMFAHVKQNERTYVDEVRKYLHWKMLSVQQQLFAGLDTPVEVVSMYMNTTVLAFAPNIANLKGPAFLLETIPGLPHPLFGLVNKTTSELIRETAFPFPVEGNQLSGVMLARMNIIQPGEVLLTNIEVIAGGSWLGYPITGRFLDPTDPTGLRQVEGQVYMSLSIIQKFLGQLANTSNEFNPDARNRVFTVIRSSWVAQRLAAAGLPASFYETYDQTGIVTGVSHGVAVNTTTATFNGSTVESHTPMKAVFCTDPTIRGVAQYLEAFGYAEAKAQGIRSVAIQVNGTEERHFVAVTTLTNLARGLDWWMVNTVDEESVLGLVQKSMSDVQGQLLHERAEVRDRVSRDEKTSLYIVTGVSIGVLLLSGLTAAAILKPIEKVQKAMSRVASMDLENLNVSSTSVFYEARAMQRDFVAMVDNLIEYRAYVPSSLLTANNDMAGSRRRVQPPSGNIACMFTDIQGSTQLWKRSAEDMNTALEMHNETIRASCIAHDGYEVKTIGDSFMVAFQCPKQAAACALEIQQQFAGLQWPMKELSLPDAGLVIRIGINYGSTITEENPLTGRVDYRGGTINMASRLEGKALGGTTCISSDMYAAIRIALPDLGGPRVESFGTHDIKGLGDGHRLYLLCPQNQAKRLRKDSSDCNPAAATIDVKHAGGGHDDASSVSSANEATGRRSSNPRHRPPGASKMSLQVSRACITAAVCRMIASDDRAESMDFDSCNIAVKASCEAAMSLGGVVVGLSGSSLTVSWNASKRCTGHTMAGLSFVAQLHQRTEAIMRVGVATGAVQHGNFGTQKNRFATVFGVALESAAAVADLAYELGTYSLFADCTPSGKALDVSVKACCRLVDLWYSTSDKLKIQVMNVDESAMLQRMGMWEEEDPEQAARAQKQGLAIRQFCTKFATDEHGAREHLMELSALAEQHDDELLKSVIGLLSSSRPVVGCRCAIRFSRIPAEAQLGLDASDCARRRRPQGSPRKS